MTEMSREKPAKGISREGMSIPTVTHVLVCYIQKHKVSLVFTLSSIIVQ